MSCRSTKGGTLAHRLARASSGLTDSTVQSLFHALKREGSDLPAPTAAETEAWRERSRAAIIESNLSLAQTERSEHDLFLARDETPDGPTFYSWSGIEARARQEAVIRSVKGLVVDLEEPGSQADNYTYGEDGRPVAVWYASYGSNLSRSRFMTYLAGGTPEGTNAHHSGARDKTEPDDDVAIRYRGRMHFAASSGRWGGGGVAFIDNDSAGHALGRAYKIGMQQFDDVVAQENGLNVGEITVNTNEAISTGTTKTTYGLYGTLVHIGDYRNAPVFTFTGRFSATDALNSSQDKKVFGTATNTPSNNYIRMIANGLQETFEMSPHEQVDYIRGSLGAQMLTKDYIHDVLATPPDVIAVKKWVAPKGYIPTPSRHTSTGGTGKGRSDKDWTDKWANQMNAYRHTKRSDAAETDNRRYTDRTTSFDADWPSPDNTHTEADWWNNAPTDYDLYDAEAAAYKTRFRVQPAPTPYVVKRCPYCQEPGHKMQECPALPSNQ